MPSDGHLGTISPQLFVRADFNTAERPLTTVYRYLLVGSNLLSCGVKLLVSSWQGSAKSICDSVVSFAHPRDMGSLMGKADHCSKSQTRLFFSVFEAHHDGRLFIATEKWDERCAYSLMQKQMIVRLYNHVYADPAYWNDLGIEDRIFSWHPPLRSLNPKRYFVGRPRLCSMVSDRHTHFSIRYKFCCREPPGAIRTNSLSIVAGGRAKCGSSVRLR